MTPLELLIQESKHNKLFIQRHKLRLERWSAWLLEKTTPLTPNVITTKLWSQSCIKFNLSHLWSKYPKSKIKVKAVFDEWLMSLMREVLTQMFSDPKKTMGWPWGSKFQTARWYPIKTWYDQRKRYEASKRSHLRNRRLQERFYTEKAMMAKEHRIRREDGRCRCPNCIWNAVVGARQGTRRIHCYTQQGWDFTLFN